MDDHKAETCQGQMLSQVPKVPKSAWPVMQKRVLQSRLLRNEAYELRSNSQWRKYCHAALANSCQPMLKRGSILQANSGLTTLLLYIARQ
jgi:hypothetical protein